MSIIEKAAYLMGQSAHEQHRSTAARASRALESNKERRGEIAQAQHALDERRIELDHMMDGKRKNDEGVWVEVSQAERAMHGMPSKGSLNWDLRRAAADEKRLWGELEILRRTNQTAMSDLRQAQEVSHKAKADAEAQVKDEHLAQRANQSGAASSEGEGELAEAQFTAREIGVQQKARATMRMTESAHRMEEKVEEAHEHEHAAIDDAASGSFFGALFGGLLGLVAGFAALVTGLGAALFGPVLGVFAAIGAGFGVGKWVGGAISDGFGNASAQQTAWAENATLDKTEAELEFRRGESLKKSSERSQADAEGFESKLREARRERRA